MEKYEFGNLVLSKAGHDKDRVYVILKEDLEYVYLVDGKFHKVDSPKKKNKKHIQYIENKNRDMIVTKTCDTVTNELVKRVIKLYLRRVMKCQKQML